MALPIKTKMALAVSTLALATSCAADGPKCSNMPISDVLVPQPDHSLLCIPEHSTAPGDLSRGVQVTNPFSERKPLTEPIFTDNFTKYADAGERLQFFIPEGLDTFLYFYINQEKYNLFTNEYFTLLERIANANALQMPNKIVIIAHDLYDIKALGPELCRTFTVDSEVETDYQAIRIDIARLILEDLSKLLIEQYQGNQYQIENPNDRKTIEEILNFRIIQYLLHEGGHTLGIEDDEELAQAVEFYAPELASNNPFSFKFPSLAVLNANGYANYSEYIFSLLTDYREKCGTDASQ